MANLQTKTSPCLLLGDRKWTGSRVSHQGCETAAFLALWDTADEPRMVTAREQSWTSNRKTNLRSAGVPGAQSQQGLLLTGETLLRDRRVSRGGWALPWVVSGIIFPFWLQQLLRQLCIFGWKDSKWGQKHSSSIWIYIAWWWERGERGESLFAMTAL